MNKIKEFEKKLEQYKNYEKERLQLHEEKDGVALNNFHDAFGYMSFSLNINHLGHMGSLNSWFDNLITLDEEDLEYFRKKYINDKYRIAEQHKLINKLEKEFAAKKTSVFDVTEDVKRLRVELFQEKNKLYELKLKSKKEN